MDKSKFTFLGVMLLVVLAVTILVLKQTRHIVNTSISSTASEGIEIEDTNYEVESEGNALDEGAEEEIEEDIDHLSIENEQEQEAEKPEAFSNEKNGDIDLPSVIAPFGPPVNHGGDGLRIGFVTDIHASSEYMDGKWNLRNFFVDRLDYFLKQMNDKIGPDMLIVNGDVIEGSKVPFSRGMEELRQVKDIFDQTSIDKYWVIGNHDLRSVQKSQWEKALGINYTYESFKIKGYKIIILDSNFDAGDDSAYPGNSYTRGNVSKKELSWLKKELSSSEKKIIFIHHPPLRGLDSTPDIQLLKNARELRDMLAGGNVSAVFSGHVEDLYSEEDNGVKYFVFPGLTKSPNYQGSFVSIDVDGDEVTAKMSYIGKDGNYKTLDIKKVKITIK